MSTESLLSPPRVGADPDRARAWVEVDLEALVHNARTVARLTGTGLLPMVKADAYGLGVVPVVRALGLLDPVGWGVATVSEGIEVREAGGAGPVQVFAPVTPSELRRGLASNLRMTLPTLEALRALPLEVEGEVEVEVDTGMGRAGFAWEAPQGWIDPLFEALAQRPGLRWTGVFTHLHSSDDPDLLRARASAETQLARFDEVVEALLQRSGEVPGGPSKEGFRVHVANSGAALRLAHHLRGFDAVRPGIALYGGSIGMPYGLRPVASVRARLVRVVEVPPGTTAGYSSTYTARDREWWGTLAIGYGDGLPRSLSNRGRALLHGRKVGIIGRISMDMTVVNLSELVREEGAAPEPGAVATLLGTDPFAQEAGRPAETLGVEEVARQAGTIDYEILVGWTSRLPRVYREVRGGNPGDPGAGVHPVGEGRENG